ncbi:MAG TPA: hypothetical protein PKK06_13135 [Phycisphaerae bacterium]|nr:hypothetical protein [Phycisphaerae bacterium]HNU44422.1 hypothetical protein [Phycisphaerae bacterium]
MRKAYFIIAVLALSVTALPALGDMQLRLYDGYGTNFGGEFDVDDVGSTPIPFVTSVFQAPHDFITFCIEGNEYVDYDTTYDVVLNTVAIRGGVGGGTPDPLDAKTAYLFSQFTDGTLSGYDYADSGIGRDASANELQEVIYYLEQESATLNGQALTWYNEAATAVAAGGSWFAQWGADSIGNVRVMNLYAVGYAGNSTFHRQDLLVRIPAPGAVVLGALGLGLVGWINRRRS